MRAEPSPAWSMHLHFLYRDPRRRAELYAVLESGFPGLTPKIDAARALGFDWDPVTTPFVARAQDDRIVTHVGVLDVPLRLDGRAVRVAGLHAVCTHPEHRRRGHYRRAMERALRFVDERWERAQLYTNQPALYEPFGFRVIPTKRWEAARSPGPSRAIAAPVDPDRDRLALIETLARRAPVSHVYASADDGWLFGIDAVLEAGDLSLVRRIPELELFVAGLLQGDRFTLYDVVGSALPSWRDLAPHLPGTGNIGLAFTPDRFGDAQLRAAEPASKGSYMVRGPFDLEGRDFAVPRLAQH